MSLKRSLYPKREMSYTTRFEEIGGNIDQVEEEEEEDLDEDAFLQDVPYTSNSIDRSSIGSIPWAEDAIKHNQIDWEHIENMLSGKEELPEEAELRTEIKDWQRKFPQLLGRTSKYKQQSFDSSRTSIVDSLDLDSILNASLCSDESEQYGRNAPAKAESIGAGKQSGMPSRTPYHKSPANVDDNKLSQLFGDFTLTSVPLKLRPRSIDKNSQKVRNSGTMTYSVVSPPSASVVLPPLQVDDGHKRLRMPPILNVLESSRRFLGLTHNNKSFVQLTQVPQAKSALVNQQTRRRFQAGNRSVWHAPIVANRFFNNRNSIVLPAIRPRHIDAHHAGNTTSTVSDVDTFSNTAQYSMRGSSKSRYPTQHILSVRDYDGSGSALTTPTTHTTSSGRSISAAVQHPRPTFNALYLPYSASKFKVIK